jgi:hypothetical protein
MLQFSEFRGQYLAHKGLSAMSRRVAKMKQDLSLVLLSAFWITYKGKPLDNMFAQVLCIHLSLSGQDIKKVLPLTIEKHSEHCLFLGMRLAPYFSHVIQRRNRLACMLMGREHP